jgi:hypothetical protein
MPQSIGALVATVNSNLQRAGVEQQRRIANGRVHYRFLVPLRDGRRMAFTADAPLQNVEVGGKIARKIKGGIKKAAKGTVKVATKVAKSKAFGKLLKAGAAITSVVPGGQALGAGLAAAAAVQSRVAKAGKVVKGAKNAVRVTAKLGKSKPKAKALPKPKAKALPKPKPRALPPPPPPPAAVDDEVLETPADALTDAPAEAQDVSEYGDEPSGDDYAAEAAEDLESDPEVGALLSEASALFASAGIEQQTRVANGRVYHRFLVPLRDGRRLSFEAAEELQGVEIGATAARKTKAVKQAKAKAKGKALTKMVRAAPKVAPKAAKPAALKKGAANVAKVQAKAKAKPKASARPQKAAKPAKGSKLALRPATAAKRAAKPTAAAARAVPAKAVAKRPAKGAAKPTSKGRAIIVRTPSGRQARVEFL